jgi:hypothetical protein
LQVDNCFVIHNRLFERSLQLGQQLLPNNTVGTNTTARNRKFSKQTNTIINGLCYHFFAQMLYSLIACSLALLNALDHQADIFTAEGHYHNNRIAISPCARKCVLAGWG